MGYSARRGFTNGKISGAARQAELQQKIAAMQEKMTAAQDAVEAQEFTASVGGGVVEAKVNGKKEVLSVTIKPEAVDPEDVEMLQDLVVSAVNEALRQANDAMDKIISYGVDQILYISCNPKSLANNLYYMQYYGYEVKTVKPFDNFPGTKHVETVCLLSRKDK